MTRAQLDDALALVPLCCSALAQRSTLAGASTRHQQVSNAESKSSQDAAAALSEDDERVAAREALELVASRANAKECLFALQIALLAAAEGSQSYDENQEEEDEAPEVDVELLVSLLRLHASGEPLPPHHSCLTLPR